MATAFSWGFGWSRGSYPGDQQYSLRRRRGQQGRFLVRDRYSEFTAFETILADPELEIARGAMSACLI
jgi:hypothetical protein